ncbi:amino acid adenylation domain-containing protein [Streptomyces sp. LP11]|uniref:Amino acid adenylation domain-containing protein n=1 Tax=Streptomyces pyxinicus TaxID=2970331 RepID=A0ABT2AX97_9ACTN|nr:non-ribosomal peptide synthetase [Streptomyces sp. LP11]MCS0600877.1 amino acid adenylation domain-containing protein [Streptomyces sp. LP11]
MTSADSGLFLDNFIRQAAATPDQPAAEFGDRQLTYAELDARAAASAARLRSLGVGPGATVGVFLEPSLDLVASVLAVARAGAAWLPLDPSYPADRLSYMIRDSGAALVVADASAPEWLRGLGVPLADPADDTAPVEPLPLPRSHPDSAAYVIYTSGSTGRPKGVTLTQRGLANLADAQRSTFTVRPGHRVLQFASPSFDASVFELAMALCSGATLVLPPRRDVLYGPGLGDFLADTRISHITLPPSVLAMVPERELPYLETIVCAGEALPQQLVDRWAPGRAMFNAYGPTETTVWASVSRTREGGGKPVIGRAIDGVRLYVLDESLRPVPAGEPGELVVGGAGVARGYIGRPVLTAERFVADPDAPGERAYRTGDLVRMTPDGELDFLGRIDQQVKLNGFRIEPDEIAGVLREHPAVRDVAVVVARVGDEDRLVGYVVAPSAEPLELREFAAGRLPHFMVPSVALIDRLPLLPNGKLDRAALPALDRASLGLGGGGTGARTETERRLAEIVAGFLGIDGVGVDDDFFLLGGHSLLAGRLAARVRSEFRTELPISSIYEQRTVARMAAELDRRDRAAPPLPPVVRVDRDRPLPLSFPQERIWFLEQLSPGNLAYNAQATIRLRGPLDAEALGATITEVVRRHEIFRTAFTTVDGVPMQEVRPPMTVRLPVVDLEDVPEADRERRTEDVVRETIRRPFELTDPPLARWLLIRHAADDHTLVQVEHHFVHDGWSFGVLLDEIRAIYPELAAGRPSPLPEPPVQYADFAAWQRAWMRDEVLERHLDYWKGHLKDAPLVLDLPTDRPRPRVPSFHGAALRVELPAELSRALRESSERSGVTLFASMLSGFAALLSRYSGQSDLVVGTGAANRRLAETERMLGMVVNTLPLRLDTSGSPGFDGLRRRVNDVLVETSDWQDVPLDRLVEAVAPPRVPSINPLFQVMFSFHNAIVPDLEFGGVRGTVLERHNGSSKMDMNIVVVPRAQQGAHEDHPDRDRITLIWEYASSLFDEDTMRRMVDQYLTLLRSAVADPGRPMDRIELAAGADADDARAPLGGGLGERVEFSGGLLTDLVDAVAAASPHAPAVTDADTTLTYAELTGRANHLATRLRTMGITADTPVGLWMDRSAEMTVTLLAILKAGGAFLPLDPDLPVGRVTTLLTDAGAPLICTDTQHATALGTGTADTFTILDCGPGTLTDTSPTPPDNDITGDNLISLYYTSGSTGTPKGVASTHTGWTNRMQWMQAHYPLTPGDTVLHKTVLSFDDSAVEILWPLIAGATVVILPPGLHRDPRAIADWTTDHHITALHFVPSMLTLFLDEITPTRPPLTHLRHVISSGEALRPDLVTKFHDRLTHTPAQLHNQWGATEVSIDSTSHTCLPEDAWAADVPLGEAIANNQVLVLDEHLNPVPDGVPGELYLGGAGLARGYLGDARKTAAAFLPHPFAEGERLYRTGDRGVRRPDGRLTFLGRADSQVKIRGIRIEPAEIEHTLRRHPHVRDAVVTKWEPTPGDHRLAAYLTTDHTGTEDAFLTDLNTHLSDQLPLYMIPSSITLLDHIPVNANGKTDHRALPAPRFEADAVAVRPATEAEQLIDAIWAEVLDLSELDIHANFFALGGHSLLATRIVSRLRTALSVDIPLALIFDNPTIHTMATALENLLLDAVGDPEPGLAGDASAERTRS